MFWLWDSVGSVLGVQKIATCKNFSLSKLKLGNISKQDIGTSFKSEHTARQSSKLTHALNLIVKIWEIEIFTTNIF